MNKNDLSEKQIDSKIDTLLRNGLNDLYMKPSFKNQLLDIPGKEKPLSSLEAFLEKEICIPILSVPALALCLLIIVSISLNSLIFLGEIPKEKYEIIEFHNNLHEKLVYPAFQQQSMKIWRVLRSDSRQAKSFFHNYCVSIIDKNQ